MKYQTTLFPNGIVAGVFGTSANNNDVGVLNLSWLTQHLERILFILFPQHVMPGGLLPALYGDSVFLGHNYSTIISRYDAVGTVEQQRMWRQLNFRMSGIRQSIEHMYGQLFNLFHLLKTPRQFKLYSNGELAYRTAVVCFLLLNCYTCFNGSACNSMFNTFPPTIQEYLPVEEELILYVEDDNNIYDFYILDDPDALR